MGEQAPTSVTLPTRTKLNYMRSFNYVKPNFILLTVPEYMQLGNNLPIALERFIKFEINSAKSQKVFKNTNEAAAIHTSGDQNTGRVWNTDMRTLGGSEQ